MQQEIKGLLGLVDGAKAVPHSHILAVETFRDACRMSWMHRRVHGMTLRTLAEVSGLYPSHVTDYLNQCDTDKHGKARRDLPASKIAAFESVTGNTYVSQWLALQSGLTVLESLIAERKAA
ncbi:XRE family transcriptional regulator [Actimicrobium sp. CCC2.4]|uniref:XRE family transcriptional regulator n=1 Tax=Actimicrobium sp. CCC2.4 TaxID=3048606 RepID=UPI002AC8D381|nr:XRE family transcriptional regulator [Actimicrobium sp. CCC2.4]MEB0133802.1 XRE family transcriptional regulator [Actimicrobium sp. CCC2.4]WPX31345.1 XRE family transcriptional regulator [Actimicrobium sp. CCC2.4]